MVLPCCREHSRLVRRVALRRSSVRATFARPLRLSVDRISAVFRFSCVTTRANITEPQGQRDSRGTAGPRRGGWGVGVGAGGRGVCIGARRGLASGGSGGSTSRGLGTGAKIVCCCSLGRASFFSRGLARPHLESSVCCGMGRCFVCPLALNAPMTPAGRAKGRPQDSLGGMANPSRKCLR